MALKTKDYSVTGKSSSGGITYTYILRVTENSASLVNGKPISNITVQAILKSNYSGLAFSSYTTTVTASINGKQIFSDTAKRALNGTSEHIYYTWSGDIEHNADGTMSITVGGQLWQADPGSYCPQTLTITESSSNAMVLTTVSTGLVRIHNGSSWEQYIPYIHNGTTWVRHMPYVHDGTNWVLRT